MWLIRFNDGQEISASFGSARYNMLRDLVQFVHRLPQHYYTHKARLFLIHLNLQLLKASTRSKA